MESKLLLRVTDLEKTRAFYTAIGMEWFEALDGSSVESALNAKNERSASSLGMPSLWGSLGGLEFIFYLDEGAANRSDKGNDVMLINTDSAEGIGGMLGKLERSKILIEGEGFDPIFNPLVLDPDGRRFLLCPPSPYRC